MWQIVRVRVSWCSWNEADGSSKSSKLYPGQIWVCNLAGAYHAQSLSINRWLMYVQQCNSKIRLGLLSFPHLPSSPPSTVYWYWISRVHQKELLKPNNINRMLHQHGFKLQMPLLIINTGSARARAACYRSSVSHLLPQTGVVSHRCKWSHQFCRSPKRGLLI